MGKSIIYDKSFAFSVRIVNLYKQISETKREFVLSKQLLRSGTAVGALVRESQNAESLKDFIHKLSIAQKECGEVQYWLELMKETTYISEEEFESLYNEVSELLRMNSSAIITSKNKIPA